MRAKDRDVSRRTLLTGCALGALTPCIAVAETSDLENFLRLSAELTGRTRLPVDSARIYLQSLGLDRGALRSMDPLQDKDSDGLARRIVADWYSGQTVDSGRMICVDYTGALMWDAMGFAGPRGIPWDDGAGWALTPIGK
ncbi:sorbitol dehydrogenase family protein [Methylocystis rosea]|nr:sorbitol dehydrogenase family protein [Methylocystis rosea]